MQTLQRHLEARAHPVLFVELCHPLLADRFKLSVPLHE